MLLEIKDIKPFSLFCRCVREHMKAIIALTVVYIASSAGIFGGIECHRRLRQRPGRGYASHSTATPFGAR